MSTATTGTDLPVYARDEVPEHLRTVTQLKADRLKLAPDQATVAYLHVYRRGHGGWQNVPLYDPAGAVKMRPLSAKQQATMETRRTCPQCGVVREQVVHRRCVECWEKQEAERRDLRARTCQKCSRVSAAPLGRSVRNWTACVPCRFLDALQHSFVLERRALWERTCLGSDCDVQIATPEEIAAAREAGTWNGPWRCAPCAERWQVEQGELRRAQAEAEERAREARQQELWNLELWAAAALEDPNVVILDTETTGLEGDSRIVEISVLDVDGTVLLDTLVNPGEPIPTEATDVHGITDAMVTAPGVPTFSEVLLRLTCALNKRRCLIYNAPYDTGMLLRELAVHYEAAGHDDPAASARAWVDAMAFEDVMVPYSDWFGDWSEYWGNYAWQPLDGGHRALGDCRAVVERLREMAARRTAPAAEDVEGNEELEVPAFSRVPPGPRR